MWYEENISLDLSKFSHFFLVLQDIILQLIIDLVSIPLQNPHIVIAAHLNMMLGKRN